ncbi:hypothetical protein FHX15_000793 [Rhizobium sp. BK650]|nr:hypothetical protein [Rhizobium sp. BK650]
MATAGAKLRPNATFDPQCFHSLSTGAVQSLPNAFNDMYVKPVGLPRMGDVTGR